MNSKKVWTQKENEELYNFIQEGLREGKTVRFLAEQYAQMNPELTTEQVRSNYYKITYQTNRKFEQKPWTAEEDDFLLDYIKENETNKNKVQLFDELSEHLNRNPRAISSHYYTLIKKQEEEVDIDKFIDYISKVDTVKLEKFLKLLKEFEAFDDKAKEYAKAKQKINLLTEEKEQLDKELKNAQKIIENYQTKFKTLKKHNIIPEI